MFRLEKWMRLMGKRVVCSSNSCDALALFLKEEPQVLLISSYANCVSTSQMLETIKESKSGSFVILMYKNQEKEFVQRCKYADMYMQKPVDPLYLFDAMQELFKEISL
ncbi:hypothetical protein [Sulfurimonas sp.]